MLAGSTRCRQARRDRLAALDGVEPALLRISPSSTISATTSRGDSEP